MSHMSRGMLQNDQRSTKLCTFESEAHKLLDQMGFNGRTSGKPSIEKSVMRLI